MPYDLMGKYYPATKRRRGKSNIEKALQKTQKYFSTEEKIKRLKRKKHSRKRQTYLKKLEVEEKEIQRKKWAKRKLTLVLAQKRTAGIGKKISRFFGRKKGLYD